VILFIPGIILSFILYLVYLKHRSPDPDRVVPLYLLALGIQFLHFAEEYTTGFTTELPKLIGQEAYPIGYWLVFNMVAYFVFAIGGIILFKRINSLLIIPIFFILVGVMLNAVGHIILSLYTGGYFPGLYTALLYTVIGPILLRQLFNAKSIRSEQIS